MIRCIVLTLFLVAAAAAQEPVLSERSGFSFGAALGAGTLRLNTNDTITSTVTSTLPNIRIAYQLRPDLAVGVLLPGAIYAYQGKDRGFEAVLLTGQYWFRERWWVLGGAGMTLDAPAFYTVSDPSAADFHTGFPALAAAVGYELWQKDGWVVHVQYRFFTGKTALPNGGERNGVSNMFSIGIDRY
jgi:hypothetical protein